MSGSAYSLIVPNLDSLTVDRAVDSALAQAGDVQGALEVIVVGRDGPGRLAGREDVVRVEAGPLLPGAARNRGIDAARGAILLFLDADCVAASGWLAAHVARHAAGESVVGGAVLWDEENYWTLADNIAMFHAFAAGAPAGPRDFLPTLNLSVSRAALEAAGPMDPSLRCGEDVDWTIRLADIGARPYFEPAARVWHRPPRASLGSLLRHHHRTGRWMPGVRRRHPGVFGTPGWLYRRWLLALLGPAVATWATARIYRPGAAGRGYPATWPAVWAAKAAWVAGALRPVSLEGDALE